MVFLIVRASASNNKEPPCERAVKMRDLYYKSGRYRDTEWGVEINTLDELMQLMQEVGDIVITKDNRIIIYDDYIE